MSKRREIDAEALTREPNTVETELVERDHRWMQIIRNFETHYQWAKEDAQRKAATWRVFAPATLAFLWGAGLGVALRNVWEIKQQNKTLGKQ